MKWGALADHFVGVAWKRLSAHEVDPETSNGHEFQGVEALKRLLGTESRRTFVTTYLLLSDGDPTLTSVNSTGEWYDSRANSPNRAAEWRLYYPADVAQIQLNMRAGDLLVITLTKAGELVVLLAQRGSSREAQLRLLFGLGEIQGEPMQSQTYGPEAAISFLSTMILEELGLGTSEPETRGDGALVLTMASELTRDYPTGLPRGAIISRLVQDRLHDVDLIEDPDGALVRWIEAEEALFRRWEDGLIERRLVRGFAGSEGAQDVQAFRDFSMSIRQSRVSRAGGALQLHTARILEANKIRFEAQATTENGERPDFLFPGGPEYRDPGFPHDSLRLLAVKFTAKDRWRQVLNEGARIPAKHLLTLEPAISNAQVRAMQSAQLQLVIPEPYLATYRSAAGDAIQSFRRFLADVRDTQAD